MIDRRTSTNNQNNKNCRDKSSWIHLGRENQKMNCGSVRETSMM
ncbi:hypothetical protein PPTG_22378 [Phytophthora nicotianae INRA-310]|uniref:Uncharacterized protein n=2 Tax=Phytophthora nicotianae TaxID=4792 RepID=W2QHE7_PHYN3|nr:hypothetical protein PPTG_22378 [Phytophthora nicotianae INRA-310]ETL45751.1 hypothetical protein L916_04220 [Phytophthora nicotianae]ETN12613.1 hypothetical protein PPTG_22378 [Phytophthora nicotianae INRA-310]